MKQAFRLCSAKVLEVGHELIFRNGTRRTIVKLTDYTKSPYSAMRPGKLAEFTDGSHQLFSPTEQVWHRWSETDMVTTSAASIIEDDEPDNPQATG